MTFGIESKFENGFNKIILRDYATQTSAEIIPACGAILNAFTILNKGQYINVIEQYTSKADFTAHVEQGFKSCKLSPFACRVKNATYHFNNEKYTLTKFTLNGNALHGLLYDAEFTLLHQKVTGSSASVVLLHQYRAIEKGYPFNYDCIITYKLESENALHINTEIINQDIRPIPVQDGWHPYFTFGGLVDDLQLEFKSTDQIIFDQNLIPTGEKKMYSAYASLKKIGDAVFDNCFSISLATSQPACILRDPAQKLQLEIYPDNSYPYLQIYTPPHRHSIAIENLSAIPDAFNNAIGLITLPPGVSKFFSTAYKITLLTNE